MSKTFTLLALFIFGISKSQTISDFENFTLPADSFYYDATGADWQTTNASFEYDYSGYWSSGFAYTNKQNVDSGNYRHLYNCIAGKGYNLSNYYATGQANAIVKVKSPDKGVSGFYLTNTTYAYKSMKNGDLFAKKFGGATGNDPDWFKLTVIGYKNGILKTDSVHFYLADFRFSNNAFDYILKSWQWVDCNKLGPVDSVQFLLSSSDVGGFGMNTPAFFSIDNFTTAQDVSVAEVSNIQNLKLYPNPANDILNISLTSEAFTNSTISVYNSVGELVKNESANFNSGSNTVSIDIQTLNNGLYFIEIADANKKQNFKFIKN